MLGGRNVDASLVVVFPGYLAPSIKYLYSASVKSPNAFIPIVKS